MGQFSDPVATHLRTNEVEVPPRAHVDQNCLSVLEKLRSSYKARENAFDKTRDYFSENCRQVFDNFRKISKSTENLGKMILD